MFLYSVVSLRGIRLKFVISVMKTFWDSMYVRLVNVT